MIENPGMGCRPFKIRDRTSQKSIVKAEKIEASEEKINEKLEEMAKNYGKTAEELKANENVI